MADINLNIALSVQEAASNIQKFTDQAVKGLSGVQKQSEKTNDSLDAISKNTSIVGQAFATFIGNVATGAFDKLTGSVSSLYNTFVTEGIKAYSEQEDAVAKLNSALLAQGDLSKEVQKSLLDQASALQAVTKFGDETIISVQSLIANLTDLDANGIKRATEATLNLSSALGIDAETAATTLSKALEGNVAGLKKYGIAVKAGATDTETFNNVLGALEQKFGTAATNAVNTFSGATTQLKNTFGDLQEETGSLIAQNPAVIEAVKQLGVFIRGVTDIVIENRTYFQGLISQMLLFGGDVIVNVIQGLDYLQNKFTSLSQVYADFTNALAVGLAKLKGESSEVIAEINRVYDEDTKRRSENFEQRKKILEETQLLAQKNVESIQAASTKEQEIANTQFQSDEERRAIKREVEQQHRDEEAVKRQEALAKEIEELIAHNENLKAIDGNKYATQISANEQLINKKVAQLEDGSRREIEIERKLTDIKRRELNARLSQANQFFGNLATLSQTGNQELFAIGKAAAIAQAVVSGATAINNALAVPPYPVGVALAASAAIAAGVQIAAISAQKLATGITEVPKGFGNDTYPALLTSGERVISVEQNKDLKSFMEEDRGSRTILNSIVEKLDYVMNRPIVVEIEGREVFRAVNTELQAGRAFS